MDVFFVIQMGYSLGGCRMDFNLSRFTFEKRKIVNDYGVTKWNVRNRYLNSVMSLSLVAIIVLLFPSANLLAAHGDTTRVSIATNGVEADAGCYSSSMSADGRYVVFSSSASNLIANDTNGQSDIFVHDRQSGTTTRVSVDSSGGEGNAGSNLPSLSGDGRYVTFASNASNLVANDVNGQSDIFIHDRQSGATTRMSLAITGGGGDGLSVTPSLANGGRYVLFYSYASNLVTGDTNGEADVFVHDRQDGTISRVSLTTSGAEGNSSSLNSSMSADGRYVAFLSFASNLVVNDTNGEGDVFVRDRQSGVTTRVSVDSLGVEGNVASYHASLSADGRYVAFTSRADNLINDDTNGQADVFVHDRQSGITTRVSVNSMGTEGNKASYGPSLSGDGRYVAFASSASNLVADDTNGEPDIFIHNRASGVTTRVSVNSMGTEGDKISSGPFLSVDGRYVTFTSLASNLVANDINENDDIFVHEYKGLFSWELFLPAVINGRE